MGGPFEHDVDVVTEWCGGTADDPHTHGPLIVGGELGASGDAQHQVVLVEPGADVAAEAQQGEVVGIGFIARSLIVTQRGAASRWSINAPAAELVAAADHDDGGEERPAMTTTALASLDRSGSQAIQTAATASMTATAAKATVLNAAARMVQYQVTDPTQRGTYVPVGALQQRGRVGQLLRHRRVTSCRREVRSTLGGQSEMAW